MNILLRLRKTMPVASLVPFKYLLYSAMLSDVVPYEPKDEETKYGVFFEEAQGLYDRFHDWDGTDVSGNEVFKALQELSDEGLIFFDEENRIYLGEYRGSRFFPFEMKSSFFDYARELLEKELERYGSSKSAKDKSRSRYIKERISRFFDKGVGNMTPGDFTELHSYLYEIYTGGEIYIVRNKVENYQTSNMLKAYDRFTVFSLIVESTLHYDDYKKKGVPTLTNVAVMKDDVFRALTKTDTRSKEYMSKTASAVSEDSEF